ncbi:hypothetical protein GGF37_003671 [Kickxella alabastrina]|nr:hypothetical protein GGF37_003671 [Kickxella alabastrina]
MGLVDAFLVLRATKKVAKLAVGEAAAGIEHHFRTSSLFSSRMPLAVDTESKVGKTTPCENNSRTEYRPRTCLSGLATRELPIALHPAGLLDRNNLIRSIRAQMQAAEPSIEPFSQQPQQRQQQHSTSEIRIITADLTHLRLHTPPPPVCLRGEQLRLLKAPQKPAEPIHIDGIIPESNSEQCPELIAASMPSTRVSRLFHYGSLAVGLGFGALGEATKRWSGLGSETSSTQKSVFLSKANIDRVVSKLSKMRGAALKLGQMLSIQDSKNLSPEISEVLQRVQNLANYVPLAQVEKTMRRELGLQWREGFEEFSDTPFAAASIGQVHEAQLNAQKKMELGFGRVAVKMQYPGVADSIDSDLNNMQSLLMMSKLLPRGMYLDNTIRVARKELHWECDYEREAQSMEKFGQLLANDPVFVVPRLVSDLSSKMVLTAEFMEGTAMKKAEEYSQEVRDHIGTHIMRLCLQELFEFEFMQTDPNWANFLYNTATRKIVLLDFGASRSFDKAFLDKYLLTLKAAMDNDREACRHWSTELGFLTGYEADIMTKAHIDSVLELGKPFATSGIYDFGNQDVSKNVRSAIPVMLRHRLTPPPDETYSLHRKLSGAFLLCIRLHARVPCQDMFKSITAKYTFSDGSQIKYI